MAAAILNQLCEDKLTVQEAVATLTAGFTSTVNIREPWSDLIEYALLNTKTQTALVSLAKALLEIHGSETTAVGSWNNVSLNSHMAHVVLEKVACEYLCLLYKTTG